MRKTYLPASLLEYEKLSDDELSQLSAYVRHLIRKSRSTKSVEPVCAESVKKWFNDLEESDRNYVLEYLMSVGSSNFIRPREDIKRRLQHNLKLRDDLNAVIEDQKAFLKKLENGEL